MSTHYVTDAPRRQAELLSYEAHPDYTRQIDVLLAGAGAVREVTIGRLVGRITASGKLVAWAPAANDGSETAAGVVLEDAQAAVGADGQVLILARGPAIVRRSELDYGGATAGQIAAAEAVLLALGIRVR